MTTNATKLSHHERVQLLYLHRHPLLWGGHLKRGEPLNDPQMIRWRELGLIEAVDTQGYRLTDAGRIAASVPEASS